MTRASSSCCILLFFASLLYQAKSEGCMPFPDILQNKEFNETDYWYSNEGTPGKAFRFVGNSSYRANIAWGLTEDFVKNNACIIANVTDNLFKMKLDDTPKVYCIRLVQRGPNILQISAALKNDTTTCDKQKLETLPSLLISSKMRPGGGTEYNQCHLQQGAYLFTTEIAQNATTKEVTCKHPLPGRLEVNCMPEDGMTFSFPDETCIPVEKKWSLEQNVMCLSSWTDGKYKFTVLGTKYFLPEWCLRTAANETILISGARCPMDESLDDYIIFNLTQIDTLDCADDWVRCATVHDVCSNALYASYCRKTCNQCHDEKSTCEFESSILSVGKWWNTDEAKPVPNMRQGEIVEITTNEINFVRDSNYTCIDKVFDDTYVLKPKISAGCRPRVVCGSFSRLNPPVLRYRLSQPTFLYSRPAEVCQEAKFQDDPLPVATKYRSVLYRNLFSLDPELQKQTSQCMLRGNFTVTDARTQGPEPCNGTLSALNGCVTAKTIKIIMTCQDAKPTESVFTCYGEVPSGTSSTRMMLTTYAEKTDPEPFVSCWVVESGVSGHVISVLPSAQCNQATPIKVALSQLRTVLQINKLERSDTCDVGNETSSPSPITGTSTDTSAGTGTSTDTSAGTGTGVTSSGSTTDITASLSAGSTVTSTFVTSEEPTTPAPSNGMSGGQIFGIIFGVFLALGALALALYYLRKIWRRRRNLAYASLT